MTDKKKILMVDDETEYTGMTKLYLEDAAAFDVKVLNHGKQAVETARSFKPDLILLDISMPNISGKDVAKQIQSDGELGGIPIVFFTGAYPEETLDENGLIDGIPYLTKPTSGEALLAFIQKHLASG